MYVTVPSPRSSKKLLLPRRVAETYPICEDPLSGLRARRSFTLFHKSSQNHGSCGLKEAIRYDFRAGARAIRYSVNMALGVHKHFFQLAYL